MDRILPTPVLLGFPCGSVGKESTCNVGGPGSIPGLGRSRGEGKGYPLQYSGLENSMGLQRVGQDGVTFTFTGGLVVKNPPANTGDAGLVPWLGGGQGNPLQYSCLENPHLQRSLAGCSPLGCKRAGHEWVTKQTPRIGSITTVLDRELLLSDCLCDVRWVTFLFRAQFPRL